MRKQDIAAIYLNAGSNLTYITGTKWYASERMVGAILPAQWALEYIAPDFEESTLQDFMLIEGRANRWQEHESAYRLFVETLQRMGIAANEERPPDIGICKSAAFFIYDGIRPLENAHNVTEFCRKPEVRQRIRVDAVRQGHDTGPCTWLPPACCARGSRRSKWRNSSCARTARSAPPVSYFCIVLFGEATALQTLKPGDTVLIDTGCRVHNYVGHNPLVCGEISARQLPPHTVTRSQRCRTFTSACARCWSSA